MYSRIAYLQLFAALFFVRLLSAQETPAQETPAQETPAQETPAQETPAQMSDSNVSALPEANEDDPDMHPPVWRWRQMLMPVRVAGQLSEFDVHPENPNLVIAGTQEGTILRTDDGGITWREIELDPYVVERRLTTLRPPGLPNLGDTTPPGLVTYLDPPFAPEPAHRISAPFRTRYLAFAPEFMSIRAANKSGKFPETVLRDAISNQPTRPVRRVVFCPGGPFEAMIATDDELLGSTDQGVTFVRLLRIPGGVRLYHLACSKRNPKLVYVTTSFGPFLSRDGGITFDQDLSGWPGRGSNGAAFDPDREGSVFVATDHVLFRGDPRQKKGLEMCYPDFDNVATAPWTQINWVEIFDGQIWLATDDGVRRSRDSGTSWNNIDTSFFGRHTIRQVTVGQNERGGTRIVVAARNAKPFPLPDASLPKAFSPGLANTDISSVVRRVTKPTTFVYSSDDNGETWQPFLVGMTRRLISRMRATRPNSGASPQWWILDGGAIWTTAPVPQQMPTLDRKSQSWAKRRLHRTPPLRNVVERVLYENDLHEAAIQKDWKTQYRSFRLPSVHMRFRARTPGSTRREDVSIFAPSNTMGSRERMQVAGFITLWWDWPNTIAVRDKTGRVDLAYRSARSQLFELKRTLSLLTQDLWRERQLHLQTLAKGLSDRLKTEILRERVVALEAALETWMRQPLSREVKPVSDEEWN